MEGAWVGGTAKLQKKSKKDGYFLVFWGFHSKISSLPKMATTTAPPWPFFFVFPPWLGDCTEIRLVGASVWGFRTRPRGIFCVVSSYLELHPEKICRDELRRHPRIASHAQTLSFAIYALLPLPPLK